MNTPESADLSCDNSQLSIPVSMDARQPKKTKSDTITVNSEAFRTAMQFLAFPSRCTPLLTISISQSAIILRCQTTDEHFYATARLANAQTIEAIQPFTVSVDRYRLLSAARFFEDQITFEIDSERSELKWRQGAWSAAISVHSASSNYSEISGTATPCDGGALARAIQAVRIFAPRSTPSDPRQPHGARVWNGAAMCGTPDVASIFESDGIPQKLDFCIPLKFLSNACHVLKSFKKCDARIDETRVHFSNDCGLTCGWDMRESHFPTSLFAIFDNHKSLYRVRLNAFRLFASSSLCAIEAEPTVGYFHSTKVTNHSPNQVALMSRGPAGNAIMHQTLTEDPDAIELDELRSLSDLQYDLQAIAKSAAAFTASDCVMSLSDRALLLESHAFGRHRVLINGTARRSVFKSI